MIIVNGTIRFKRKAGGGLDSATGYPIAPTTSWSDALDCQFVPTSQNLQAKSQGEPTARRGYAIYIEGYERCVFGIGEQIALYDRDGHAVGEYSILSVTPLRAVDQTRLDV